MGLEGISDPHNNEVNIYTCLCVSESPTRPAEILVLKLKQMLTVYSHTTETVGIVLFFEHATPIS